MREALHTLTFTGSVWSRCSGCGYCSTLCKTG